VTLAILLAAVALGPSAQTADPIAGFWLGQSPVRGQFPMIQVQGPGRDGLYFGLTGNLGIQFQTCPHPGGKVIWEIKKEGTTYSGTHWGFADTTTCDFTKSSRLQAAWSVQGNRLDVRLGTEGSVGACGASGTNCYVFLRCGTTGADCGTYFNNLSVPTSTTSRDTKPPSLKALASSGKRGGTTTLRFRANDNSGTTKLAVEIRRGGKVVGSLATKFGAAKGNVSAVRFRTPSGFSGNYTWCATAADKAGNRSARSCAALRIT